MAEKQQHEKIKGYRTLSDVEIALMNEIKEHGERTRELIEKVKNQCEGNESGRWASIAQTDLQKGYMALNRAVAQPTSFC